MSWFSYTVYLCFLTMHFLIFLYCIFWFPYIVCLGFSILVFLDFPVLYVLFFYAVFCFLIMYFSNPQRPAVHHRRLGFMSRDEGRSMAAGEQVGDTYCDHPSPAAINSFLYSLNMQRSNVSNLGP